MGTSLSIEQCNERYEVSLSVFLAAFVTLAREKDTRFVREMEFIFGSPLIKCCSKCLKRETVIG